MYNLMIQYIYILRNDDRNILVNIYHRAQLQIFLCDKNF